MRKNGRMSVWVASEIDAWIAETVQKHRNSP